MSKKTDKLIEEALKRFDIAYEAEKTNRKMALEAIKFRSLEQWPDQIKRDREADPDGARPTLVIDKTNQYLNQVKNDQRQNSPAIKIRPVDDKGDVRVAEVLQGIIRNIEDQSSSDLAYDTAFEHAIDGGFGYWRILTEYEDEKSFHQDIRIQRIRNRFNVYLDPDHQQPDGSDAKWGLIIEDMDRDEFKIQYPKADPCDFKAGDDTNNGWVSKTTVRLAEYFRIVPKKETIYLLQDGTVVTEDELESEADIVDERETMTNVVKWSKITCNEELEKRDWEGKYIPIVEVIGNEIDVQGVRKLSGMIESGMDAQRMYNYAASQFVEMVSLAPKSPWISAAGQTANYAADWRDSNRKNLALLEYDPVEVNGNLAPPPMRQPMQGIPAGWQQMMQNMESGLQGAFGMYSASIGEPSNEKSGRAIIARQREGDVGSFHYVDNLARSIRHTGRILIDLIPKIYDTARIARILGEDGEPKMVKLDPEMDQAMRTETDEVSGKEIGEIFNLGIGRYDVSVNVGPSYSTKRQEEAESMVNIVTQAPSLMPVIGDLMFKSMDSPGSDEIAERLKKMLPPELKDEEGDENPEQMKQAIMAAQQDLQAKQQQVMEMAEQLNEREAQIDESTKGLEKLSSEVENDTIKLKAEQQVLNANMRLMHSEEKVSELRLKLGATNAVHHMKDE